MIRRFMKYYRPYMHILIWVIVGTFVMAGLDLIFPVVVRELIHDVLPAGDMHRLFIGAGILLVLYILNFAIQYAVQYYGACHECVHRTRHATGSVCSYREALLSLLR